MPDCILWSGAVGERAEVGTEERLALGGRPHPLVQLVEYEGIFRQLLHYLDRLQSPFPLQTGFLIEEVANNLPSSYTLKGR